MGTSTLECRSAGLLGGMKLALFICVIRVGIVVGTEPRCPTPTEGLASHDSSRPGKVEFLSHVAYPVDITWVDFDGEESQRHTLQPGHSTERSSYRGHVFRVRQTNTGILLAERTCGSKPKRVTINSCLEATEKADYIHAFQPQDVEATLSLIHDQDAPCEPAEKSHLWSCVRKLPAGEEHVPKEQFGFQEADVLDTTSECKTSRKHYDTTDDDYSNIGHRLDVKRVSQGPGYLKMSIKPELQAIFQKWTSENSHLWQSEEPVLRNGFVNAEEIGGCYANTHAFPFAVLDMDKYQHIRAAVVEHMQNVLEWWTNRTLQHTSTYGLRIYRRNAMLINHVDRGDTHIASAVLQVFQDCDEGGGWPLEVVGEDGLVREVYLQPGEMVLYEGARLLHGRPMRFKGNYFGNIFSHFKPASPINDPDPERSDL